MTPTNFRQATQMLGRPDDMTDEQCGALHIARGLADGYPYVVSCWQPTDEERAAIASGAPVYLHVVGAAMPPVCLSTQIEVPLVGAN